MYDLPVCMGGHKYVVQYLVEMANCDISEYNSIYSIPGTQYVFAIWLDTILLGQILCDYDECVCTCRCEGETPLDNLCRILTMKAVWMLPSIPDEDEPWLWW